MNEIICGDVLEVLKTLESESVQMVCTSPPYWGLRDYQVTGQIGLEKTPEKYVAKMVEVFREVRRVLRKDGTLWLNLGSSYSGSMNGSNDYREENSSISKSEEKYLGQKPGTPAGFKPKDLVPIPWMVAMALQADGWYLRQDIIWAKPNPMPESVTDRCTKSHEYIFLLTKSARYFYDAEAIKEPAIEGMDLGLLRGRSFTEGYKVAWHAPSIKARQDAGVDSRTAGNGVRNRRDVWTVATKPFNDRAETFRWKRVLRDGFDGDMRGIVSLNSQPDGGLFDLVSNVLNDEHGDCSPSRISGICDRLSLEPKDGFVPIEMLRVYYFLGKSLDYFLLSCFGVAKNHSNENHKTGLFVSTKLSCRPSAQRTSRIVGILKSRGLSLPYLGMIESNKWPDEMASHLWGEMLYHNDSKSFYSYDSVYRKTSEMSSHFATFPEEIPLNCIKAGTSEKGCCPKCGAPVERVTEYIDGKPNPNRHKTKSCITQSGGVESSNLGGEHGINKTIGWQPTCECGGEPVPCVVLDPFSGAGTTCMVAKKLNRNYLGIELNQKYVEMSNKRIETEVGTLF